ncbi:MAG: 30S ribosomal protein S1 [Proteobacteria bacterium]|nr:30S ribosomal protein S1 [Pseudomonadota bacterium]
MSNSVEPKVGDILDGRIIKLLDWGALIALPGDCVGRLSNSQISWSKKRTSASEVFVHGANITVVVHEVNRSKTHGKLFVSLGYRELQPNPWSLVEEKYPIGTRTEGKLIEFLPFGATVELDDEFSGLLHDSEISWTNRNAKVSETFCIGDKVSVVVIYSDKGKRKLHLSYRETQPDPWLGVEQMFPVGMHTEGLVVRRVDYGTFVELNNGCIALLHKSQVPPTFDAEAGKLLDVVITDVDSLAKRISLTLARSNDANVKEPAVDITHP